MKDLQPASIGGHDDGISPDWDIISNDERPGV